MINKKIIKWFSLLIIQLKFYVDTKTNKDKLIYSYKLNSISKALAVIRKIKFKITSGNQLKDYKSIGKGTINRINEILITGKLAEINNYNISDKHIQYIDKLIKIFGIGRIKAYELYTKHEIKTIYDLKLAIKKNIINLPESIIKGIKYVNKIKTQIPRSEIKLIYYYLIKMANILDPKIHVKMCGSYRRKKEISNDIDVIISHPYIITQQDIITSDLMMRFIKLLKKKKFIIDSFTSDNVLTKYMGVCKITKNDLLRRIDIRFIPQESYYTSLLYFTGSSGFNRRMRSTALSMGYSLNEYRLLNEKSQPMIVNSEKDVFNYLNMEYINPKYRE